MSDPKTAARTALMDLPAAELTRRRTELQSAAEQAGLSLDEITEALNTRADLPRPLLPEEREALVGLLQHRHFPGRDELLRQVDDATVVGYCGCGCASVGLALPSGTPRATAAPGVVPTGAEITSETGEPDGGLIIFVTDGHLSALEIWNVGTPISPIPPLSRITFE